jgi:RHS repeat-associated protein
VLTGVMDENNSRYDSTWYDNSGVGGGRAIQTALSGGVDRYSMANTLDGSGFWPGRILSAAVTSPLGATLGRSFVSINGSNRLATVTHPASIGSPAGTKTLSYDANGNVAQVTDFNGDVQCSVYDLTRNQEIGRVEGMAPGSSCPGNILTYVPASGTVERKSLTQWHSIWHLPTVRSEPQKITTWVYNGDGGAYCAPTTAKVGVNPIGVVCSRSEQATTDLTGGAGFGATASGSARVWSYTYNSFGQVLTEDGPRTDVSDVTTYTYNTCTTGHECGQIHTVTDALGHFTTFSTYNAHGQPLTITDINGVVTTLAYDSRLRLTSRQIGTETTGYSYYPTGQLKLVTHPDGSTILYNYDAAHRLTDITDGLGNHIHLTLDAMGNITNESAFDPSSAQSRTLSRAFNDLSELSQQIAAAGTAAVTTTVGHDSNGNPTSVNQPLSRNIANLFDALNRKTQTTDPASGVAQYGYDANDNIASVTDPRNLVTSYTNNGFDQVSSLTSPDAGAVSSTYDSAGNLSTTTNARGVVGTYIYDALNRPTQIQFAAPSTYPIQSVTKSYVYDTCTYGKGRLCELTDAVGTTQWTYTAQGRVASRTEVDSQIIAGSTYTLNYGYNSAGQLTSLQMPSGSTVNYTYNGNNQISAMSVTVGGVTTPILSNVTYEPFGAVRGWTWGNGATVIRSHDSDGNVAVISSTGLHLSYQYDDAQRITGMTDLDNSALNWTYGYDALDRLTSATRGGTTLAWTYDANGNRLTEPSGVAPYWSQGPILNYNETNNQFLQGSYPYISFDETGNAENLTSAINYDAEGNASQNQLDRTNGLRQRVVYYIFYHAIEQRREYDEEGRIIGQYDYEPDSGPFAMSPIQETIWLGDIPVAMLSGSRIYDSNWDQIDYQQTLYYVHADHLGTPRRITRPADNLLVWRWDSDPFGLNFPNGHPTGSPLYVSYDLRLPGQIYDGYMNTYYNWYRDYDPSTGRYLQSDPIGLQGGINTYAYVEGNPISNTDPLGLDDSICMFNPAMCGEPMAPGYAQIPSVITNATAGVGDSASLNLTSLLRDALDINGEVDKCSPAYRAGGWATFVLGAGRLAYAGLAKGYSIFAASGAEASAGRSTLRQLFGGGQSLRPPNLTQYPTDAALRAAAGRTNPLANAAGAAAAGSGAAKGSGCGCSN